MLFSQRADGLLGLGDSPRALPAQLAASGRLAHVFGLCFGFPSGGALLLGDAPLPAGAGAPVWTPMLPRGQSSYYVVELLGIDVGAGPAASAAGSGSGGGGGGGAKSSSGGGGSGNGGVSGSNREGDDDDYYEDDGDAGSGGGGGGGSGARRRLLLRRRLRRQLLSAAAGAAAAEPAFEALPIDAALFRAGFGSVMDSGTTFNYLPTPAFEALARALEARLARAGLKAARQVRAAVCTPGLRIAARTFCLPPRPAFGYLFP